MLQILVTSWEYYYKLLVVYKRISAFGLRVQQSSKVHRDYNVAPFALGIYLASQHL